VLGVRCKNNENEYENTLSQRVRTVANHHIGQTRNYLSIYVLFRNAEKDLVQHGIRGIKAS
jgi:hypothetical protein